MEKQAAKPAFSAMDIGFSLVFLVMGWLFWELQIYNSHHWFSATGVGIALFWGLYVAAVLAYLACAKRTPPKESWFWLAIVCALAGVYAVPNSGIALGALHYVFLVCVACYWTVCASGRLLKSGKTSNWLLLDGINALFVVPWGNFFRLPKVLWAGCKQWRSKEASPEKAQTNTRAILWTLCGVVLAVASLCFVLQPLMTADRSFKGLLSAWTNDLITWTEHWDNFVQHLGIKFILALPTAMLLYGLVYGCVHGRRTCVYNKAEICFIRQGLRFAPCAMVCTTLFLLCFVYMLFVSMQTKYLFGLVWGQQSVAFSFSDYTRHGFFELCQVAGINLVVLALANTISRESAQDNRLLRLGNVGIAVLTVLLLATAACKLGLYLYAYGFTVWRVVAGVFLLWLTALFVLISVRQYHSFNFVRAMVFSGVVLFTLLCVAPLERGVDACNAVFSQTAVVQQTDEAQQKSAEKATAEQAQTNEESVAARVRSLH